MEDVRQCSFAPAVTSATEYSLVISSLVHKDSKPTRIFDTDQEGLKEPG